MAVIYICNPKNNSMITVDAVSVMFSGASLFSDVSFVINDTDRIALMGKNGARET